MENKTDAQLQILEIVPETVLEDNKELQDTLDLNAEGLWQVVVKYNNDVEAIARLEGGIAQIINNQFAVISLPRENINNLLNYTQIEYVEAPKRLRFNIEESMLISCITAVQKNPPYQLSGEGVLLGIIDSGIDYAHPDFINLDGTSRIAYLWDQSIRGNPPVGFTLGTEYTNAQINEALSKPTRSERLAVVPSEDTVGHGTHVAGIAGGNGRSSGGNIIGAAPRAEFIIVKLAEAGEENFVRNIEIMLGVKYAIEKAVELQKPIAINLSLGMNEGPHDGNALLEQYLDDAATLWQTNIIVGTGNEGVTGNHTSGRVGDGETTSFQVIVPSNQKFYQLYIWQEFIDELGFRIISPAGERSRLIVYSSEAESFVLGNTQVYASFAGPSPLSGEIEFALWLTGIDGGDIASGPWTVEVYGQNVVSGRYNVWGQTNTRTQNNVVISGANPEITLTTPSTANRVISVGAYDGLTGQIANFSGRGFAVGGGIKPDLVAPGVNIQSASVGGGYRILSGTSMAAPHVTGGVALMMEWGIVRRQNLFLYGENLRTYLLRGARRTEANVNYPSPLWGYGKLCIKNSLDLARKQTQG